MKNKTAYMQYTIDGEAVDVSRLIKAVRFYRPDFIPENQPEGICRTSEAAKILRHYGHEVGYNPEYAGEHRP